MNKARDYIVIVFNAFRWWCSMALKKEMLWLKKVKRTLVQNKVPKNEKHPSLTSSARTFFAESCARNRPFVMSHWALVPPLIMHVYFIPFGAREVQQNTNLSMKLTVLFLNTGLNGLFPRAPSMIFFWWGLNFLCWAASLESEMRGKDVKMATYGPFISLRHNAALIYSISVHREVFIF